MTYVPHDAEIQAAHHLARVFDLGSVVWRHLQDTDPQKQADPAAIVYQVIRGLEDAGVELSFPNETAQQMQADDDLVNDQLREEPRG